MDNLSHESAPTAAYQKGLPVLKSIHSLTHSVLQATDGEIGKVEECLFDDEKWTVRYLVVKTGSWLSGKKVLISPKSVRGVNLWEKSLLVSLTRKQVEQSPDIDTDKPVSRQMETQFHDYYGWPYYWADAGYWGMAPYPGGIPGSPYHQLDPVGPSRLEGGQKRGDPHLRSTREVTGYGIEASDDGFGHVQDFIVDDASWGIRYLVIDTMNFWPSKSVVLAPEWVDSISWTDRRIRVGLSKESIKSSPEYRTDRPFDRDYEERLYSHYGRARYWDQGFTVVPGETKKVG